MSQFLNRFTRTYLDRMNMKELGIFKVCLLAMGTLLGLATPKKSRNPVAILSTIAFLGTYIYLMRDMLSILFPKED